MYDFGVSEGRTYCLYLWLWQDCPYIAPKVFDRNLNRADSKQAPFSKSSLTASHLGLIVIYVTRIGELVMRSEAVVESFPVLLHLWVLKWF